MTNVNLHEKMSRRTFVEGAIGMSLLSRITMGERLQGGKDGPPMNILYIHSHDSGRYLHPFGQPVPTPAISRLASEGILFRKAFCAAPTCSPSRACLFTGQYAHQNGMLGLAHIGWQLNDYQKTIVHTLHDAGYMTVLGGLQHIAPHPDMIGYDMLLKHKSTSAVDVAPAVVDFLNTKPKVPFFLDVGFFETHRFYPKQPNGYPEFTPLDNPNYIVPPAPLPDTADTRKDMAGYFASARVMDQGVAAVLTALEANGYNQNTLIISTTDHGIPFPDMKCSLTDFGMGVSLIIKGPGFSGGQVCDAMVTHMDIYPTLCELLHLPAPTWLEGKSLLPLLRGEVAELHQEIFAEVNYHAAYEPKRAVRTERWKYIRRYDGRKTAVLPNCDDGLSKTYWLENGWQTNPLEADERLHDLIFDPNECNNLIHSPYHQETAADMRQRLDQWMKRTNDPLLQGPIPLPHGAKTYDPNAVSDHDASALRIGT